MKRVTTILTTALLASSLFAAAEAHGRFGGGGHIAGFGGGAHIGGVGAGSPTGGSRVAIDVGGIARGGKGFRENYVGRGDHGLSFHHHAIHHSRRVSPEYGERYDPRCHLEATEGDEFPCFPGGEFFLDR